MLTPETLRILEDLAAMNAKQKVANQAAADAAARRAAADRGRKGPVRGSSLPAENKKSILSRFAKRSSSY